MPHVEIPDSLLEVARQKAADSGFASVDEFILQIVRDELDDCTDGIQVLFTPERLAHIDRAMAQIEAGQGMTLEQVDAELAKRRALWLQNKSIAR